MRCPSCGNSNREGARFCDNCGTALEAETAPRPDGSRRAQVGALPAEAPAEIAGRYTLVGFLGRGGRKRVYLARDGEDSDREVAIAIFETEGIGETSVARARREAQAMERLGRHPRIVDMLASGEHEGAPYLVSEYVPGGELAGLLADAPRGRLEPLRAIEIAADICRALEHAHGHGIVHRDLKPANVWIGDDGHARLGDFGLAATERRSREVAEGGLVGTVAYLPPEQALGRRTDARADLYSLGALLYEMVTGQPPFSGDDAVTVISRHVNAEPVPPRRLEPSVPPALDRLILRLLAKSPDERPANAAETRSELEAIAADPEGASAEYADEDPLEALATGTIVGRERELRIAAEGIGEALSGNGNLLLFAGEPGIGKTRLAEELATIAGMRGARVVWGHAHEGERAPAFWPWTEALREFARDSDPVGLRWQLGARGPELARIVPDIAELLGIEVEEADTGDTHGQFRLFDAVAGFLADASRARPLVVVLEDLHWADASSLELLRFTGRQLADTGLLVVGTFRDVELGQSAARSAVLDELSRSDRSRVIRVEGLGAADVADVIETTTGVRPSEALARTVWERTEGNPFYVGEIVRLLAAEGALDRQVSELPVSLPEGIRAAVDYRLERLSGDSLEVLRAAAVAGREFEPAAIELATGGDAERVAGALGEALDAHIVSADATAGEERLSFCHAIVRETLYTEIEPAERTQLHAALGRAIETLHAGELDGYLDDLARHFIEAAAAGEVEKALEYAVRAARQATRQLAHDDAAAHYSRALELVERVEGIEGERHLELSLARGRACALAGRLVEARESFEHAAGHARELGSTEGLAQAALGVQSVATTGQVDEALLALLQEAVDSVGEADSALRVELLSAIAARLVWRDPQGEAQDVGAEALAIARRLDDAHALGVALATQQVMLTATPQSPRDRLENADELIDAAERCNDGDLAVRGYAYRLHSLLELGEVEEAERTFEHYARVAKQLRQPQHLWHVPLFLAVKATMDGRFADAERYADEARRGGERAQEPLAGQFHALQIAVIRQVQGRLEEALPAVREMAERFPAIRAWQLTLTSFLAELGSEEEARAGFERIAAGGFEDVPRDLTWIAAMVRMSDAAHWLGDGTRAQLLFEKLEPFSGLVVVVGRAASSQGPVDFYLGRLAFTAGRAGEAVARFEAALTLAEHMHDRPFILESRYGLGRALAARGRTGDREGALEELTAALDGADAIGMRRLVERALAARLEVQGLADIDVLTSIEAVVEAVGSERPDLSAVADSNGAVTILFTDIENSTLINERLGDARWLEVLREHNSIFRRRLAEHGGYEVKSQGDGFMLAFADPAGALEFAVAVQRDLATSEVAGAEGISVRMGMHSGEAIAEEGDLFGRSVVLAARIAAQAVGGEILVSEALVRNCSERTNGEFAFDDGRELELKGLSGTHRVHRVELAPALAAG
jgi:class 3 adenylate cyclase